MGQQEQGEPVQFERCVCCGRRTQVCVTQEIESRRHYIPGAGQLCPECYFELVPEMQESDQRIAEEILRL